MLHPMELRLRELSWGQSHGWLGLMYFWLRKCTRPRFTWNKRTFMRLWSLLPLLLRIFFFFRRQRPRLLLLLHRVWIVLTMVGTFPRWLMMLLLFWLRLLLRMQLRLRLLLRFLISMFWVRRSLLFWLSLSLMSILPLHHLLGTCCYWVSWWSVSLLLWLPLRSILCLNHLLWTWLHLLLLFHRK